MAVNAQSFLETIQRNAQKNIPTNKIKKAAVPDLSMFGIPSVGITSAGSAKPTVAKPADPAPITPNKNSLMTGVNATASPIKAAPTCEPQSSFLPRQEAAQGQVYPELEQNELLEDEANARLVDSHARPINYDEPRSEEECSAAIEYLMEQAVRIRRAVDSRRDIAERLENQQSEFSTLFQSQYTPKMDFNHFVSNAELARTVSKQGILRVAAYIRVSTDSDDQENSYETQDKYFTSLLQQNPDWTSAGVYADYGISGTNKERRTGYKRLLRHCQEGKIDRIVCKSISRFARNTSDFMTALDILHDNHVTILFEKENLDTQDSASNFILTTLAAIAQEESRTISTNIQWSNQKRFPKGHTQNIDLYGYRFMEGEDSIETLEGGYQIRRLEIVEEEAEVIRYIFNEVNDGKPYVDVARELNNRHIPAPNEGKKPKKAKNRSTTKEGIECGWTGAMISRIISLERYCGDVLLQKTYTPDFLSHRSVKNDGQKPQYMVRDHHPAIIDRELFESVQIVRSINSARCKNRSKEKTLYAFSSRLTCAHCGRYFNIRNAENNRIWFCPTAALNNGKNVCHAEKVYEEQVVRMFRKAFIDRFDLVAEPVLDDVTVADIMSGRYGQDEDSTCTFTQKADDFVSQIWIRLNNVQRTDNMERDRGFLKRQIDAQQVTITEAGKRTRRLISEKDTLETRRNLLGDTNVTDEEIAAVRERLETETARLQEAQGEKARLEQHLSDLEAYWEKLEGDYQEREKALEWMKTLPEGHEGTVAFLNGLTSDYVRAFALDITVYYPLHYTVHWFDDTKTEVEMYSNVEDFRYTSDYFDGQRMRSKHEFRRA
jgi:DNA invertase Pin-like site-specific DNA recombinase